MTGLLESVKLYLGYGLEIAGHSMVILEGDMVSMKELIDLVAMYLGNSFEMAGCSAVILGGEMWHGLLRFPGQSSLSQYSYIWEMVLKWQAT